MKQLLGPVDRLYPMPCVLVVGGTMQQADTLAVAWINIVSSTPATIAMGLGFAARTAVFLGGLPHHASEVPSRLLVGARRR